MNFSFPIGITFHHFHGNEHPLSQGSVSAENFERMLRRIGLENILSPEDWIRRSNERTLARNHRCITFDDNLRCQFDIALPVLERLGIMAFWFINTSVLLGKIELLEVFRFFRTLHYPEIQGFYSDFDLAIDRSIWKAEVSEAMVRFSPSGYLNGFDFYTVADKRFRYIRDEVLGPERYMKIAGELMTLKEFNPNDPRWSHLLWMDQGSLKILHQGGHHIGMHSHSHPTKFKSLPIEEQRTEYRNCYDILSSAIGRPPVAMSHPCNSYNSDTLSVLKELGIRVGFRANTAMNPYSPLEQPRLDQALHTL